MRARAKSAEETSRRTLDAALDAFSAKSFADVTLQEVAERADVSVQTIIRRFGSKGELFEAVAERERSRVVEHRAVDHSVDLRERLAVLVRHYEAYGETVLRLIEQEDRSPVVARVVSDGRDLHRAWVEDALPEACGTPDAPGRTRRVDAALAATDLFTWRLLRIDVGRSQDDVVDVMLRMVDGLTKVDA